jgi:hypothetical protein
VQLTLEFVLYCLPFQAFLVMTQMLGLLSRIQGIWDNLVTAFLSYIDFGSSSLTWTSLDCLYDIPDDDPHDSKVYYRTLAVVLQPLVTVLLVLLCAAIVWCVKALIYRKMKATADACVSGPSAADFAVSGFSIVSSKTQPSADLAFMRDNDSSIVSSGTAATTLTSDTTPYGAQMSMAVSMHTGKPLPGLVKYMQKYIALTTCTAVFYFYTSVTVQLMSLFSCKQVDQGGAEATYVNYLRAVGTHWSQVGLCQVIEQLTELAMVTSHTCAKRTVLSLMSQVLLLSVLLFALASSVKLQKSEVDVCAPYVARVVWQGRASSVSICDASIMNEFSRHTCAYVQCVCNSSNPRPKYYHTCARQTAACLQAQTSTNQFHHTAIITRRYGSSPLKTT